MLLLLLMRLVRFNASISQMHVRDDVLALTRIGFLLVGLVAFFVCTSFPLGSFVRGAFDKHMMAMMRIREHTKRRLRTQHVQQDVHLPAGGCFFVLCLGLPKLMSTRHYETARSIPRRRNRWASSCMMRNRII